MVFEKVRAALAEQFEMEPEEITEDMDLLLDLGADSIDVAELIMNLETEYNTVITDEAIHKFRTVRDVVNFIEEQL